MTQLFSHTRWCTQSIVADIINKAHSTKAPSTVTPVCHTWILAFSNFWPFVQHNLPDKAHSRQHVNANAVWGCTQKQLFHSLKQTQAPIQNSTSSMVFAVYWGFLDALEQKTENRMHENSNVQPFEGWHCKLLAHLLCNISLSCLGALSLCPYWPVSMVAVRRGF